jgi:hypothetical protein
VDVDAQNIASERRTCPHPQQRLPTTERNLAHPDNQGSSFLLARQEQHLASVEALQPSACSLQPSTFIYQSPLSTVLSPLSSALSPNRISSAKSQVALRSGKADIEKWRDSVRRSPYLHATVETRVLET